MPKGKGAGGVLKAVEADKQRLEALADTQLPLSSIVQSKRQPRRYFDKEAHGALVASVKQHGVLQPIVVRKIGESSYEIVAGERRYRAAKTARLKTIPVVVREFTDEEAQEVALVENLQRDDLNPVDEIDATLDLLSLRLSKPREEVISLLHRVMYEEKDKATHNVVGSEEMNIIDETFTYLGRLSRASFTQHRLPLLKLPEDVLKVLRSGKLAYTKALEVARVKDEQRRAELLEKALAGASLQELKELRQQAGLGGQESMTPNEVVELLKRTKRSLTPKRYEALSDKDKARVEKLLGQVAGILDKA